MWSVVLEGHHGFLAFNALVKGISEPGGHLGSNSVLRIYIFGYVSEWLSLKRVPGDVHPAKAGRAMGFPLKGDNPAFFFCLGVGGWRPCLISRLASQGAASSPW